MRAGSGLLHGQPAHVQWAALAVLSALLIGLAVALRLPAATMIGPLAAGIVVALSASRIQMPAAPFVAAQGVIGCMIGNSIPLSVLDDLALQWPLFLLGIGGVLAAGAAVGWQLTRWNFLPGTTAIWGVSPGGSTTMILMAEDYGADPRLVAIMQKLRVVLVIAVAALVARMGAPVPDAAAASTAKAAAWFPPVALLPLLATLAISIGLAHLALRLGVPAGPMFVPMLAAMALHGTEWVTLELPPWLLAASYAVVGWTVGLRFTRPVLMYAFHALPRILASIIALIALCGLLALVLVVVGGIDPLTAYLATSPGGADSIAIIAASTNVDMRFVLAMQTSRMVVVMFAAPVLSKYVTRHAAPEAARRPDLDR